MRAAVLLVLAAAVTAIAAAASTGAPTHRAAVQTRVKVQWNERWLLDGGGYVSFQVRLIETGANGWRVRGGFTNHSQHTLTTKRRHQEFDQPPVNVSPAIVRWVVRDVKLPGYSVRPVHFFATRITPAFPRTLGPGESWNGTISGPKRLPRKAPLCVRYGHFTYAGPHETEDFSWISDQAFQVR